MHQIGKSWAGSDGESVTELSMGLVALGNAGVAFGYPGV